MDGEVFADAMFVGWIVVVPAGFEFLEGNGVGSVAVDLFVNM